MNQWISQSMNQWINEPVKEGMDGWMMMNGWIHGWASYFSLLSYFFTERPLRWGTSSLSYFLSEQPLIWATSALSCLPASSFVASEPNSSRRAAVPMRLATSMQPQSRLPGASQQHWTLCCAQPCQCVLSQSVANLHAGALQIEQRSHSADNGNDSALLRELRL